MLIYRYPIAKWKNVILLTVGFLGCILLLENPLSLLFNIVASVGLFGLLTGISLKKRKIYLLLRDFSTTIFFVHLYVRTFFCFAVYGEYTFGMECFIVTSTISFILAVINSIMRRTNMNMSFNC